MPEPPPDEHAPDDSANRDEKQQDTRGSPSENRISLQVDAGVVLGHDAAPPPVVHAHGNPEDFSCKIEEIEPDE